MLKDEKPKLPAAALPNDMMRFYAPRELYTESVTIIELLCASVCMTSMICFTLEAKYRNEDPRRGQGNLFDTKVHMLRHRVGARGNATSFPLPWHQLLATLQHADAQQGAGVGPDLPRVGDQLADVVSILLKTSEEDNPRSMAAFIHQAFVRRHVVIELIEGAKRRGHRAYRGVDMARAHEGAGSTREWCPSRDHTTPSAR